MARTKDQPVAEIDGLERWWWTTEEIAEAWQVSPRTIYRWVEDGRFRDGRHFHRATPAGTGAYLWLDRALPKWADQ